MSATYVTPLTPSGSGAIAVLEVSGPDAWSIARWIFRAAGGKPLPDKPNPCSSWFGRMGIGAGDEVILAVPSTEATPVVEIHCHGGRQVVQMLIGLLQQEGCISEIPNEKKSAGDLLPYAKTLRIAAILLDQANGAYAAAIDRCRQEMACGGKESARAILDELTRFSNIGRHLLQPWRVAIVGTPNAGKSSLLNALAGYQRSVVAPIPGTTRDVVSATLAFDGWLVEISDTAGLREASDLLEQQGIDRARNQAALADLCLWVIDVTAQQPTRDVLGLSSANVLPVLNKIDQLPAWDLKSFENAVALSATTGQGIECLIQRIVEVLIPDAPPPGAAVPFSADCMAEIMRLSQSLNQSLMPIM